MKKYSFSTKLHDFLIATFLLFLTIALCFLLFFKISANPVNIALLYLLGVVAISRYTSGYFFGILASFLGIFFINCFFTYPFFRLNFRLPDYPFTFLFMLAISTLTSTLTSHLKKQSEILDIHEKQFAEADKEKMRANLLRAVSHDLRTPLTSIMGTLASLESNDADYTPEERKNVIRNIYDDSYWLLNMVENLLSVTRIQAKGTKLKTSPEMVEEIVAEAVSRFKKRFPDAVIDVSIPSEFLLIPMDAMLIEQVLINLLENAFIHAKSEKPPKLIVKNQNNNVCFHIIDYGIGIDKDYLDSIFDGTYYSTSSDAHKGMGIGLSICKTIITAHNGIISAHNHNLGAEFSFTLPKEEQHV